MPAGVYGVWEPTSTASAGTSTPLPALSGGVKAMKISAKVKIITIGVGAVLVLGGAGVILWHNQQPTQAIPESTVNQTTQKTSAYPTLARAGIPAKQTAGLIPLLKQPVTAPVSWAQAGLVA